MAARLAGLTRRRSWGAAWRGVKIYTRGGDKGSSSLFNGERRSKADTIFHALGDTDEVSAVLGLAAVHCSPALATLRSRLEWAQCRLLDIGSAVATPHSSTQDESIRQSTAFDASAVTVLEEWIDEMERELPPLRNFILYSGGLCSTHLHLARTVCRRAERSIVPLVQSGDTPPGVGEFVNRLSDFLFVSARYAALKDGNRETAYKKGKTIEVRGQGPKG